MRRNSILIVGLAVAAVLVVQGCSDNPAVRLRYQMEKKIFEAERLEEEARVQPQMTDREDLLAIRDTYAEAVELGYTALDSVSEEEYPDVYRGIEELTFKGASRLSQLMFASRQYDSCVTLMEDLLTRVRLPQVPRMTAHYNLGRALQSGGHWDSAVVVYKDAIEKYYPPVDQQGEIIMQIFNLPGHLYSVTSQLGLQDQAAQLATEVETYYQGIISEYPNSRLETAAHANLASFYERRQNWRAALAHLSELRAEDGGVAFDARLKMADIHAQYLQNYDTALAYYDMAQERLRDEDTLIVPNINLSRAMVQLNKGNYDRSRTILVELQNDFPWFFAQVPTAQLLKAETFEREGNWERAETEYRFLIENYAGSDQALATYLYLADHFRQEGRPKQADVWYDRALENYELILARTQDRERRAAAMSYKAELYRQKGQWQQAADVLTELFNEYSRSRVGQRAVLTAAKIYRDELGQPEVADSLVAEVRRLLTDVRAANDLEDL